jgi:hypothetical protein
MCTGDCNFTLVSLPLCCRTWKLASLYPLRITYSLATPNKSGDLYNHFKRGPAVMDIIHPAAYILRNGDYAHTSDETSVLALRADGRTSITFDQQFLESS